MGIFNSIHSFVTSLRSKYGEPQSPWVRAYKGLSGLSSKDREDWEKKQLAARKLTSSSSLEDKEQLYRNGQYVKLFGKEDFKKWTKEQRNERLRAELSNRALNSLIYPYDDSKKDNLGIPAIKKGYTNDDIEEYNKALLLSPESKIALIELGWRPSKTIHEATPHEEHIPQNIMPLDPQMYGIGMNDGTAHINEAIDQLNESFEDRTLRKIAYNNKLFERIQARDLKNKKSSDTTKAIYNKALEEICKKSDKEIQNLFETHITPDRDKGILGNGVFAAYFGKEEMRDFSIEDMRDYLAKEAALYQTLTPYEAFTALENDAKVYVNSKQSKLDYAAKLGKDILISAASYTADKINSFRMLYDILDTTKYKVFIDEDSNVIDRSIVKRDNRGNYFYKNEKGELKKCSIQEMDAYTLDMLGKDTQGRNRSKWFNNQYISDIENYGTLDEELIKKYKGYGYSPEKVMYTPGDDTDLLYETAKMTSFGLADGIATLALSLYSGGGGAIATRSASMLSRATNLATKGAAALGKGLGNTLKYSGKALGYLHPTASAYGIGNAYARGKFGEDLSKNLNNLEKAVNYQAEKNIRERYNKDKEFKRSYDESVKSRYSQLKAQQQEELGDSQVIIDSQENDKYLMELARTQVTDHLVKQEVETLKNSGKYFKGVEKAASSAGEGAAITAITDGTKYFLVNNFGYRDFLFKNYDSRMAAAADKMMRGIKQSGGKYILDKGKELLKKGFNKTKLKVAGKGALKQFWGGAWTNFTDEMQAAGGSRVNDDAFKSYLDGEYSSLASSSRERAMSSALASYLRGAYDNLYEENTWKAGLVGGLGSIFTFTPNHALFTKTGREQWKNATSTLEKFNLLVNNGILSSYYAQKAPLRAIEANIAHYDKLLKEYDNFKILDDVLALDLADMNATNPKDAKLIKFMKAVTSLNLLRHFNEDPSMQKDSDRGKIQRAFDLLKNKFKDTPSTNLIETLMRESSITQKAYNTIEKLANKDLNESELKEVLAEYYAKNPSEARDENDTENILNKLSERAKDLKDASTYYNSALEEYNKYEQETNTEIPAFIKYQLINKRAMASYIGNEINATSKELGVNSTTDDKSFNIGTYGTLDNIATRQRSIADFIVKIDNEISTEEQALKEKREELQDIENDIKNGENTEGNFLAKEALLSEISASELQLSYLKSLKKSNESLYTRLEDGSTATNEQGIPIKRNPETIKASEILALPIEDMARMLSPVNRKSYSQEQQDEIDKAILEGKKRDPLFEKKVSQLANLVRYKKSLDDATASIIQDPIAALAQINKARTEEDINTSNYLLRGLAESVHKGVHDIKEKYSEDPNLKDIIYKNLRVLNPRILKYLDFMLSTFSTVRPKPGDERTVIDGDDIFNSYDIRDYGAELSNAIEWTNITEDLKSAIDSIENLDSKAKKIISNNIDNIIDNLKTREEVIQNLQDIIDSKEVSSQDKENYSAILQKMKELEMQRTTNVEETAEGKKEREEKEKEKEADLRERIKREENKGEEKEKEKEKRKEEEKKEKRNNKQKGNSQEEEINEEEEYKEGELVDSPGAPIELTSPTLDEQIDKATKEGVTITEVPIGPNTLLSNESSINEGSEVILGNPFYLYDAEQLKNFGKAVERTVKNSDSSFSVFKQWADLEGIKLQEIIDYELADIIKKNPKLQFGFVNVNNSKYRKEGLITRKKGLGNLVMLMVEVDDKINNIHDSERGGLIEFNGKNYLVVGTLGFNGDIGGREFRKVHKAISKESSKYYEQNTEKKDSDKFYVSNSYTEVKKIDTGRLLRIKPGEKEGKISSVKELAEKEGLQRGDLKWGIQQKSKMIFINTNKTDVVHPPTDFLSNTGNVFVLVKCANNHYIPGLIKQLKYRNAEKNKEASEDNNRYKKFLNSQLKREIDNAILSLLSPAYDVRAKGYSDLRTYLHLNTDDITILYGTSQNPSLTIRKLGVDVLHVDLRNSSLSANEILDTFDSLDLPINVTASVFNDSALFDMYSDAGVLDTDIASLHTVNSSYSVYSTTEDLTPNKETTVNSAPSNFENIDIQKRIHKAENSVIFNDLVYRRVDNKWYNETWNLVTDPRLLNQLELYQIITSRGIKPDKETPSQEIFIIDRDSSNPKILVKNKKDGIINQVLGKEEVQKTIDEIDRRNKEEERKQRIKEEAERLRTLEDHFIPEDFKEGEELTDQDVLEDFQDGTSLEETLNEEGYEDGEEINNEEPQSVSEEESKPESEYSATEDEQLKNKNVTDLLNAQEGTNSLDKMLLASPFRKKVMNSLKTNFGFTSNSLQETIDYVKKLGLPTTNITNEDTWLEMLECKIK